MFGGSKPGFGSNTTNTGFGTFGNTANPGPFGQSAFGKPATTGFGSTAPVFGAPTQNTSLFGATAQPSTGLFGAPVAAPAFGVPATTQSFGFGQTQANTSLFGSNAAGTAAGTTGTLFGAPTTSSAFGQPAKSSTFGFGSTQSSGGLFGQSTAQAPTTSGLFGQTNTAQTGTGLFGNTGGFSGAATTGTVIKFNPVTGSDMMVKSGQSTSINTKHHCITCMKEYEGKSLEELRLEDYMANRKGPQAGGLGTSSPFGMTQPQTGGLFGQQNTAAPASGGIFGQQENKSLFGSTAPTIGGFGSTAPAFGATSQAGTSSLFGAKPATGFGAQPTSTTTSAFAFNTNTFGANTQAKPFGSAAPQTGLFGQPTTSAFGATNTGFGAFGAQQTQSTGLFGAKPATGTFNMPAATNTGFGAFGQTTTTTAAPSLFGAKPATTGFGTTTTGFGAPATSTGFGGFGQTGTNSLFNNSFNKPANTNTFGFGSTAGNTTLGGGLNLGGTSGSLFGGGAAPKVGGLFGSTNTTGTGLFGSTNTGFGTNTGLTNTALGSQTLGAQAPGNAANTPIHQQLILMSQPFGDSPLFKNLAPASGKVEELLRPTNPAAQKAVLDSPKYKLSASGREVKVKIKPLSWSANPKKTLFDGLEENDPSIEAFTLKPNPKRLVLKSRPTPNNSIDNMENTSMNGTLNQSPHTGEIKGTPVRESLQGILSKDKKGRDDNRRVSWLNTSALNRERNRKNSLEQQEAFADNTISEFVTSPAGSNEGRHSKTPNMSFSFDQQHSETQGNDSFEKKTTSTKLKSSFNKESDKENLSGSSGSNTPIEAPAADATAHFPSGITLTRAGYYTIPPLDKLAEFMTDDNQCIVPHFTIGREGYGNVYFNDSFDVANLNLDEIVHFRHKEVVIYPDDENKPPVGQGLNRKAQVTLDRVWPHDKTKHEPITDPELLLQIDYEEKLRRVCAKHDTRFLEYRPQTGSWVFKVDHFSKYGLSDSEDEEDISQIPKKPVKPLVNKAAADRNALNKGQKFKVVENGQTTLNKSYEEVSKGLGGVYTNGDVNEKFNGFENHEKSMSDSLLRYQGIYAEAEDNNMQASWLNYNSENRPEVRSPTSDVAKEAGTNSHKLQLMKASFFIDDDDEMKSTIDHMETYERSTPDQTVPKGPVMRTNYNAEKDNYFSIPVAEKIQMLPEEKESTTVEICAGPKAEAPVIKPTTVILQQNEYTLPYQNSICHRLNCSYLADASVFNGRRFKIGWGAQNTLLKLSTHANTASLHPEAGWEDVHTYLEGRRNNDRTPTVLQTLKIGKVDEKQFKDLVLPHLESQLEYTSIETETCPMACTHDGVHETHYEIAKELYDRFGTYNDISEQCQYNSQVWDLVKALWGNMETLEGEESTSHLSIMCRRRAFSEWLEKWSALEQMADNIDKGNASDSHLHMILDLLSQHKLQEACDVAQKNGDYYLSMLLSQISSGPVVRELVKHQLESWKYVEADLFISPLRLRIFLLVAGDALFESSHGLINICEGLDWKRALAVHLWYICMPTESISGCLNLYEKAFKKDKSSEPYACPPNPPYEYYRFKEEKRPMQDLCFHLLKLYSSHSHPLESLLNPGTHTFDAVDYRLSWFLQQSLHSIGYGHDSNWSRCVVHSSFASQLEANGLWHWAIFVLLHMESPKSREHLIIQLLNRHVSLSKEEEYLAQEQFILEKLKIPPRWLYSAKALLAGSLAQYREQADCLIKGQIWNDAHTVIMLHLAPDDFVNGETQSLKNLLAPLALPENSGCISGWLVQGQVLWDFLELETTVQEMLCNEYENMGYHLEKIQPKLSSLCSRVNLLPCPTSKHTLCQSELSKKIINIVRGIVMQVDKNDVRAIVKIITQLPMPEDYAQHELRLLIDNLPIDQDVMS